jgi:hypothetical protein
MIRRVAREDQGELGVLARDFRVRVLNCSPTGCLVESDRPVPPGTVATLSLSIGGSMFSDVVKVVRCQRIGRTGERSQLATQFLSATPPYPGSLRHLMRQGGEVVKWMAATDKAAVGETKVFPDADNKNDGVPG